MLICKGASQLISQSIDRALTRRERLALRFHLLICDVCKRFRKQLVIISAAVSRMRNSAEDPEIQMPPEVRQRIANLIEPTGSAESNPK